MFLKKNKEDKRSIDLLTDELSKLEENKNKLNLNQYSNRTKPECSQIITRSPQKKTKLHGQSFLDQNTIAYPFKKDNIIEKHKIIESFENSIDNKIDNSEQIKLTSIYHDNLLNKCLTSVLSSISSIKIKQEFSFAFDTKNGYDVDKNINKINQDRLITLSNILKIHKFNCFAVLDGHGQNGHFIAELAAQYISNYFNDSLKYYISRNDFTKGKLTSLKGMINESEIYSKFINKNYAMIKTCIKETQTKIDESEYEIDFSGCTCCCLIQIDNHLICINIGDSRAIVIKSGKEITQLSNDHKPHMFKERRRIEESGGEVKKLNNNLGPDRVWVKDKHYPGIAMSRSLGDKFAKTIGVSCDPDIIEYALDENIDHYVIIASDGLWDHISNEEAEKIVTPCYMNNDSKLAVQLLIEASSVKCIKNKENIDDISIIVVFFPKQSWS